ncbi:hypothetical protein XENTR_v10019019 [Xenopus tropicalis]|nr:hypothetical protein XENTR_v10019019 [Xenopus tropicalis]
MLQQRKHAWINRKKKAKSEVDTGKYGKSTNAYVDNSYYKQATYRLNEANKVSSSDLPSKAFAVTEARGRRVCKKSALSQSQFLPPILAVSKDASATLQPRKSTLVCVEDPLRGVGTWKPDIVANDQEKENQAILSLTDVLSPRSAYACVASRTAQPVPQCWDQKNSNLKDLEDFTKATVKTQSTDLYRACLLVIAPGKNEKKDCSVLQINETHSTREMTQRKWVQSKVRLRGISAWKSIEAFQDKAEEKLSSGDSALGTDTCSETAEVELEPGLKMEMTHYNHQRIVNWIMEVNAALFSPQTASSVTCPLTEQDTSIKIVYQGD